MNSRGAAVLATAALAAGVVLSASTGQQTFNRIAVTAPITGTGSSGSALVYSPVFDTGLYGDCSSGDVVVAADTSLGADAYYRNLTINAGKVLTTAGHVPYVCEKLTFVDAASRIAWDGVAASGRFGAGARAAGRVPGSLGGGGGATYPTTSGISANGANPGIPRTATSSAAGGGGSTTVGAPGATGGFLQGGGGGGAGGDGTHAGGSGGTSGGATIVPADGDPRLLFQGLSGRTMDSLTPWGDVSGGSGGGLGGGVSNTTILDGSGGGGGGAGGWVIVPAREIVGPGFITSRGGQGGDGQCPISNIVGLPVCTSNCGIGGGGGGGPGGVIVLITETSASSWNNVDVSGGSGGGTGSCGSNLSFGGAGGNGGSGVVIPIRLRLP